MRCKRRWNAKKTMAAVLALSMLGAGMNGGVPLHAQTAREQENSLTITMQSNQKLVIRDDGYDLITYGEYSNTVKETKTESYTGTYVLRGGSLASPLSNVRIAIEASDCNIVLNEYHVTTTKTANISDRDLDTVTVNSLFWCNNSEISSVHVTLSGLNSLTCTGSGDDNDIGIRRGDMEFDGNGSLYLTNVCLINLKGDGDVVFDGPSVISKTSIGQSVYSAGNVLVKSGALYLKAKSSAINAAALDLQGGVVAGEGISGTVNLDGACVLYTLRLPAKYTIQEGIVYVGTSISFDETSTTMQAKWVPALTGGVGTVYGNPDIKEDAYAKPGQSNIGVDLSTIGAEGSGVTLVMPDSGYTGIEAVPHPVITVAKTCLHKTLQQGVDFEAKVADSESDKIHLGTKNALIEAKSDSGSLNSLETTFRVVQSETEFLGGVKTYKDTQETDEFGYGDTITVKVQPKPNGVAAGTTGQAVEDLSETIPTAGTAALYAGDKKLSDEVTPDENGIYTMSYDTSQGALPIGNVTLTVKFTGNDTMQDAVGQATIGLGKTIIDAQDVTVTPYHGTYDAASHAAVSVETGNLVEADVQYRYSTDDGTTWTEYNRECPVMTDAGSMQVQVKVSGELYQDYESDIVTASIAKKNLSEMSAKELSVVFPDKGYYYTATFVYAHPQISWMPAGEKVVLEEGRDYQSLNQSAYTHNIAISSGTGDNAPTVTITGKGNYEGSITRKFAIRFYDREPQLSYSRPFWNGWVSGEVTVSAEGFTMGEVLTSSDSVDEEGIASYKSSYTFTGNGEMKKYFWFKEDGTGYITDRKEISVKIDQTAPAFPEQSEAGTYGINIEKNWWRELLSTLTFGLYKDTIDVNIQAYDGESGVAQYLYYVDNSGKMLTKEQLDALTADAWKKVEASEEGITKLTQLSVENSQVVYAYAVDHVGNQSAYVCTQGVAIDTTAPVVSEVQAPDTAQTPLKDGTADIVFRASEAGTVYYYLAQTSEEKPSAQQIISGAEQAAAGYGTMAVTEGLNHIRLSGLKGNTEYVVYFVMKDTAGNIGADVLQAGFQTDKTTPAFAANPVLTGTYGQKVKDMQLTQPSETHGITGTWTLVTPSEDIPSVGSTDTYEVTFVPDDTDANESITVRASLQIQKRNLNEEGVSVGVVTGTYIYDGTPKMPQVDITDSYANISSSDYSFSYSNHINATTAENPAVVTITGTGNYTGTVVRTFTIRKALQAPNLPPAGMRVEYAVKKVGEVALPTDWEWIEADRETALPIEQGVSATAVYVGDGNGNYERETQEIMIIRKECVHRGGTATCTHKALCEICGREYGELDASNHVETMIQGAVDATCTEEGYTGDTYCRACGIKVKDGTALPAKGHTWDNGKITKMPTASEDGIREYTCVDCGSKKSETIPAGTVIESPAPVNSQEPSPAPSSSPSASSQPSDTPAPTESQKPDSVKLGDLDEDGKVSLLDAQIVLKAALKIITLTKRQEYAADTDFNSTVNLLDAQKILKVALKIETF